MNLGNVIASIVLMCLWSVLAIVDIRRLGRDAALKREPSPNRKFRIGLAVGGAIIVFPMMIWLVPVLLALAMVDVTRVIGRRQYEAYCREAVLDYLTNPRGQRRYVFAMMKELDISSGLIYLSLTKLEIANLIKSDWDEEANSHGHRRRYYWAPVV